MLVSERSRVCFGGNIQFSVGVVAVYGRAMALKLNFFNTLESQPVPNNELHNQVIGGTGNSPANTCVEFPIWSQINIYTGDELLLLILEAIEASDWSVIAIVFQTEG